MLPACRSCTKAIIIGLLSSIDGYMNLAMEKTKEYVAGSLRREYGDCFIRGNNGIIV